MPQARSGRSSRSGGSSSSSRGGARARSTSSRSGSSGSTSARSGRSTSAKRTTARRSTTARTTRPKPGTAEARLEAAANRVRKVNEQIIEAGKQAGETTLSSYEKFLKSIASSLERGPGSSDVEWISNLATAQAKFIRDVTASLTKAARKRLK